ncbi:MAG: HDOD domain-containing protein [Candidatus Krumholzibacteriota bacterium]|nr:HDOD domain-containing protein [Candidatus Krumholzibacteriota bacterium]
MPETPPVSGLVERRSLQNRALAHIDRLPSLSTVVGEFLALSRREYFTAADFEKILIKDQALVARLLKVANSSFFGATQPIRTVSQAVVLIGMDNLRNLVYAVSSSGLLRRRLRCYGYAGRGFWFHSLGVAMTARLLVETDAVRAGLAGEEAFVAGLLHDLGKLILDDFLDPSLGPRAVQLGEERSTLGWDHAELGARVLLRWKIPEEIRGAVRAHHNPAAKDGSRHAGGVLVRAADAICNAWGLGMRPDADLASDPDLGDCAAALAAAGMTEASCRELLPRLRRQLETIESCFGEAP